MTRPGDAHRLAGQGLAYGVVGGAQLAVDWIVFYALTALVAVPPVPAAFVARVAGAVLGFTLNGTWTFRAHAGPRLGWRRFARFAAAWVVLTAAGLCAVAALEHAGGLRAAWIGKPAIDLALAGLGFVAGRRWIYR